MAKPPKRKLTLHTEGKLFVTKISAATSQLETAIMLWFADGDPHSIQTLLGAAFEILYALNKKRKGPKTLPLPYRSNCFEITTSANPNDDDFWIITPVGRQ